MSTENMNDYGSSKIPFLLFVNFHDFVGKVSVVFFPVLNSVFFPQNWLPSETTDPSLHCYCTCNWGSKRWILAISKGISEKEECNELHSSTPLSIVIIMPLIFS